MPQTGWDMRSFPRTMTTPWNSDQNYSFLTQQKSRIIRKVFTIKIQYESLSHVSEWCHEVPTWINHHFGNRLVFEPSKMAFPDNTGLTLGVGSSPFKVCASPKKSKSMANLQPNDTGCGGVPNEIAESATPGCVFFRDWKIYKNNWWTLWLKVYVSNSGDIFTYFIERLYPHTWKKTHPKV